eukprot:5839952-Prymnesium_polylepis.1
MATRRCSTRCAHVHVCEEEREGERRRRERDGGGKERGGGRERGREGEGVAARRDVRGCCRARQFWPARAAACEQAAARAPSTASRRRNARARG